MVNSDRKKIFPKSAFVNADDVPENATPILEDNHGKASSHLLRSLWVVLFSFWLMLRMVLENFPMNRK